MMPAREVAAFFQCRNQAMNTRLRLQVKRVLHLLEARGEASLLQVAVNIHKQFVLFTSQHGGFLEWSSEQTGNRRGCSMLVLRPSSSETVDKSEYRSM